MVEMQIILDTFILLMRRVNLLWGLKQDQRRSSLALKLTKVSETLVCIYIYIESLKMRGWTTSDVKNFKKLNKNISVRDLQLFT